MPGEDGYSVSSNFHITLSFLCLLMGIAVIGNLISLIWGRVGIALSSKYPLA